MLYHRPMFLPRWLYYMRNVCVCVCILCVHAYVRDCVCVLVGALRDLLTSVEINRIAAKNNIYNIYAGTIYFSGTVSTFFTSPFHPTVWFCEGTMCMCNVHKCDTWKIGCAQMHTHAQPSNSFGKWLVWKRMHCTPPSSTNGRTEWQREIPKKSIALSTLGHSTLSLAFYRNSNHFIHPIPAEPF